VVVEEEEEEEEEEKECIDRWGFVRKESAVDLREGSGGGSVGRREGGRPLSMKEEKARVQAREKEGERYVSGREREGRREGGKEGGKEGRLARGMTAVTMMAYMVSNHSPPSLPPSALRSGLRCSGTGANTSI